MFLKQTVVYEADHVSSLYVKQDSSSGSWKLIMPVDEGDGQKYFNLTQVCTASKAKFFRAGD